MRRLDRRQLGHRLLELGRPLGERLPVLGGELIGLRLVVLGRLRPSRGGRGSRPPPPSTAPIAFHVGSSVPLPERPATDWTKSGGVDCIAPTGRCHGPRSNWGAFHAAAGGFSLLREPRGVNPRIKPLPHPFNLIARPWSLEESTDSDAEVTSKSGIFNSSSAPSKRVIPSAR